MSLRAALAGGVLGASFLTACVLTTDLDGFAGASPPDGGPEASSAADGGGDAGPQGAGDASDAEAGASSGFCRGLTPAPLFCEDFDDAPLTQRWDEVHVPASGVLALDDSVSTSASRSLFFRVPAASTGDPTGFVRRSFPSTASKITLTFDLRIDVAPPDNNQSYAAQINVVTKSGEVRAYLHIGTGVTAMQPWENGTFPGDINMPALTSEFTRVSIALVLAKGASTLRVTYNGVQVVPITALGAAWEPGVPSLYLGATYVNSPVVERAFHYDNVVLDAQ